MVNRYCGIQQCKMGDDLDVLCADAKRYRWLCRLMYRNETGHLDLGGDIQCNWHDPNKSEIDVAIDADMIKMPNTEDRGAPHGRS